MSCQLKLFFQAQSQFSIIRKPKYSDIALTVEYPEIIQISQIPIKRSVKKFEINPNFKWRAPATISIFLNGPANPNEQF